MSESFINDISVAIETVLQQWEQDPLNAVLGRVAYDDALSTASWAGQRHAKATIRWGNAQTLTAGSPTFQDLHTGNLDVFIRGDAGDGAGDLRRCADRLSSLFRRYAVLAGQDGDSNRPQVRFDAPTLNGPPTPVGAFLQLWWSCAFVALGTFQMEM